MMTARWVRVFDPTVETVHMRLRSLREARGLSQAALARALGFDQSYVTRYEIGRNDPPPKYLKAVADYFGIPPETLYELQNADTVRESLAEPIPGPAVALSDEWYQAARKLVQYDSPADAIRVLDAGLAGPHHDRLSVAQQVAADLVQQGRDDAKKCAPATTNEEIISNH